MIISIALQSKIGNGFNITCGNLHKNGTTMISIIFFELIPQCSSGNILKIEIQCCYNIITVTRFNAVWTINYYPVTSCKPLFYCDSIFTGKIFIKCAFNTNFIAFAAQIQVTDGTGRKITVWKYPSVFSLSYHASFILAFSEYRQFF